MFNDLLGNPDQLRALIINVTVFGLVAALWFTAVTFWYMRRSRRAEQIEDRLGIGRQAPQEQRVLRLWQDGQLAGEAVVPRVGARTIGQRLDALREDAGWTTPMPQVLLLLAAAVITAFALAWLVMDNLVLGIASVVVILLVFRGVLLYSINKRVAIFEKQLVDSLDLGARSLRAGHPLSGAFRLISEEVDEPLGPVFAEIVEQESLGVSVQEALRQASDRSRSPDMRIFAASVIIQLRSGGNLAEMMERVAWVVRERMRLNRRARVLTAEAQLSKWVLLTLPVGLFVILNLINPQYMRLFYTHFWGHVMLLACLIGMLIGGWVMNRMARLKY